jgi:hypothetical protein
MSSLPGHTLEAFLCWQYNISVVDRSEANVSLGIAESIGNVHHRPILTETQFQLIINMFEVFREQVESALLAFEDDEMSWRGYAGNAFDFIPDDLDSQVGTILTQVREQSTSPSSENK